MPAPLEDLNRDHQCHFYQAPTGQRCGSPALKGEYYCYHHHLKHAARSQRRVLIDPEVTRMEVPLIEDRASIFVALAAVIHRLAENTVDTRRAGQMIYGLQVALQALPPAPTPAAKTQAGPVTQPAGVVERTTNDVHRTTPPPESVAAAPATIPISKESLIYFLRSRHCAHCNAELFPASELTERANPGAPPTIIEEARPALPAPENAGCPVPAPLGRDAGTVPTLQAVASDYGPKTSNLEPGTSNLADPQSTFIPRFALHSPRRSVSLRLVRMSRGIPATPVRPASNFEPEGKTGERNGSSR